MPVFRVTNLSGVDERPFASPQNGKSVMNMRYDASEGRWVHDRGYASYYPASPARGVGTDTYMAYSLFLHQTLGGATKDIIVERDDGSGGTGLYRVRPHITAGYTALQTGRHAPGVQEPGTSFATFGYVCVAVNGWDAPVRIYPLTNTEVRVEPFGFPLRPAAPVPAAVGEGGMNTSATAYFYALTLFIDDVTIAYPTQSNTIGLGSPTKGSQNAYRYRYTWVTDTGSESPLSEESPIIAWTGGAVVGGGNYGYRYGMLITGIQPGPNGTLKRRIYRTRNLGETQVYGDATYYFLGEIPNNYEVAYTDHIPDGMLGAEAPDDTDSAPLPDTIRWIVGHAGRAWVVSNDYRIHWSNPSQVETFGAIDYVDVSSRSGGRVTGLIPHDDLLLVLREGSLEAIVASQATSSYRAVPVTESTGSRAPHAAITVPGWGVLIVGDDGIYALRGSYTGGSVVSVNKLTRGITETWARVNIRALARAWSWWSPQDHEVVFALPADGKSYPTLQLILHLDRGDSDGPAWSFRELVQAGCGITGPEGWPYLGCHNKGLTDTEQLPVFVAVWAAYGGYGYDSSDATYATPLATTGWWESTDLDLGDPDQAKVVRTITATVTAYGENAIYLDAYVDSSWEAAGQTQESTTHVQDRKLLTVLGTVQIATGEWSKKGISEVRFDLNIYHVRRIRFRIRSESVWALHGYALHFDNEGPAKPYAAEFRVEPYSTAPTVNVPDEYQP